MQKVYPEPISGDKSAEQKEALSGSFVDIPDKRITYENLRILSSVHELPQEEKKRWVIPAEKELPIRFFRQVFTQLREQLDPQDKHAGDEDKDIPSEAFSRAFERLFYVLGDTDSFYIADYDVDADGKVGWGEFVYVFKRRHIKFNISLAERIFLTFDNPESSHLAQILSIFVLLVIVLSSLCFILSTVSEFQKDDPWRVKHDSDAKPEPKDIFNVIEMVCLIIFIIEYVTRLCTCWAHKPEVFDKNRLLELVVGYEEIYPPNPWMKLILFIIAPSNVIDLVAILPGVLGIVKKIVTGDGAGEGGGFVVLRLVRLTKIFRAFKNPKLREPVIVIAKTIEDSTKALYVLAFNLLLGILIAGSLMWVVEKGDWDADTRTYNRYTGTTWNPETYVWDDVKAESPFLSIPHAFWWAITTATTVGYGDMFPTTSLGYTIAALTMMYSLVILALPIGVIGGNFSSVWEKYEEDKINEAKRELDDKKFITAAIQRIDPFALSQKLLIELWHERSQFEKKAWTEKEGVASRPDVAEFMGEAHIELNLVDRTEAQATKLVLPLRSNYELSSREVTGTVTISYEYIPFQDETEPTPLEKRYSSASNATTATLYPNLKGELKVLLLQADGLTNCCWTNVRTRWERTSNPYAIIYCYPKSPNFANGVLRPAAWRSPTVKGNLSPRWNHVPASFHYQWRRPAPDKERNKGDSQEPRQTDGKEQDRILPNVTESPFSLAGKGGDLDAVDDPAKLMSLLQHMGQAMEILHSQVHTLAARVEESAGVKAPRERRAGSANPNRRNKDSKNQPHLHVLQLNPEEPALATTQYQLPYSTDMRNDKLSPPFGMPPAPESSDTESC